MENYFKNENVFCYYEKSCKNKSKSFCRECLRNLNRNIRDWFEPTDLCNDILKKLRNDEAQASEKDKKGFYKLKFAELTKEEEELLIDCFKED